MPERMHVDVVIVGAGIGGIAALHAARARDLDALVVEAGSGPGGTWYWNRYPGARCDIDSLQYSFSLFPKIAQEWHWNEKFASQDEILRYVEHVVDHEGMRPFMRFNTRIDSAHYHEAAARWLLRTDRGEEVSAQFCIMATGTLSTANRPEFAELEKFGGEVYHTGQWPHQTVSMHGKRVGVIGTGSSGIQSIPIIAAGAKQLTVFQRTPSYVVPAGNQPMREEDAAQVKAAYAELRKKWRATPNCLGMKFGTQSAMEVDEETRLQVFEAAWNAGGGDFGACFNDLSRNMDSNAEVMKYMRWKIAQIVTDPETADRLTPKIPWGSRRLCMGTNYYETYNRPNVTLVDLLATPIERFTKRGIVVDGVEHELDIIILATGFDAVTGTLLRMDIRGRGGWTLRDEWREGPRTCLGLMVAGFPNMFMISGPQSPGTLINMAAGSEAHAEWIGDCLDWVVAQGAKAIEPTAEAQQQWTEQTNAVAAKSMMSKGNSWWTGGNIPGKPRGYLGYLDWLGYDARCQEVAANDYEGFVLDHGQAAVSEELAGEKAIEGES